LSTSYTDTLKKIKDAEEASNREVSERKKALEAELMAIEQSADKSIGDAKMAAEQYVASETEKAKAEAQMEADALLASAKSNADGVASKKLDKRELRKILDEIVFSEFKG
jgi:vacuolar-type H+-ATPase subunit H